jgi:hypothetical protein
MGAVGPAIIAVGRYRRRGRPRDLYTLGTRLLHARQYARRVSTRWEGLRPAPTQWRQGLRLWKRTRRIWTRDSSPLLWVDEKAAGAEGLSGDDHKGERYG